MAEQKNQNEHLNVEDALTQSEAFLVKYKNAIIGGVVAVIIIVAGFIMYKNLYAEPREEKAQAALFKGQEYFEQDAYEQALNGDSIGYVGFLKVADEYSGTKAANLAKAYAGICYAQLGKYDEAVKMLDGFNGNDQMVAPAILGATGNCYAQLGQLDKAASTLISAADKADNNSLSPIFLMQAGEILVKQGKYDEAVKMLDGFNGNDQMVAPAILGATGNCYAQLGQLDKAASTLISAADKADNNSLSPIFLMQAGEILVKQGKYDDAVNAYTKIKDKYFQSYQAMDIDKYIEQAKLMKK